MALAFVILNEALEIYEAEIQYQAGWMNWELPIQIGMRSDVDYHLAQGLRIRFGYDPDDIAAVLLHGSDKAVEHGTDIVA